MKTAKKKMRQKKPLLTIIVPIKNTDEYSRDVKRLKELLNSLKNQTIGLDNIEVIVSDLDSSGSYRKKHQAICESFNVRHIYTKTGQTWNISRSRNIGIKNAKSDYVMVTDVDCIFSPSFIETALKIATSERIIHCRISDLPQNYDDALDNFDWMNKVATLRADFAMGGCQIFSRLWAMKVRGYDEAYVEWGADDTDFAHRAEKAGLTNVWIEREASFYHQWHPDFTTWADRKQIERNRERLKLVQEDDTYSIKRNPNGWGAKISEKKILSRTNDIAMLVTTFMREGALEKCLQSIREFYPVIPIYIANNGKESQRIKNIIEKHSCRLVQADFDSGVSKSRNIALEAIPKRYEYIFICEDDIIFTLETDIYSLRDVLVEDNRLGVIGSLLKRPIGNGFLDQHFEAWLYTKGTAFHVEKIDASAITTIVAGVRITYCDMTLNVFMMRRSVFDDLKWDSQFKTAPEHEDYFLSLKYRTNWLVAYTDEVSMIHDQKGYADEYSKFRTREDGFEVFSKKWNIDFIYNSWHKSWGKEDPLRIGKQKRQPTNIVSTGEVRKEIAIGIKTFLREETLFKTLESYETFCPFHYRLYIADDGRVSDKKTYHYYNLEKNGHEVLRLPSDSGISVGRNAIVKMAKESYILITDDDINLISEDTLKQMKTILDCDDNLGLVAAVLKNWNGEGFGGSENYSKGLSFSFENKMLIRTPAPRDIKTYRGINYVIADQVMNFFLAKKELFNDVKWDDRIKVEYEHMDFFLEMKKTNWKAAVCLDAQALHTKSNHLDEEYNERRMARAPKMFHDKHGIHRVLNRFG